MQGNGCVCVKNYPPEIMQPSSPTRATIVSAENQKVQPSSRLHFSFAIITSYGNQITPAKHEDNLWNECLKSRWIPGGSCGYTSGTKRKHFAALSSPRPCWTIVRFPPVSRRTHTRLRYPGGPTRVPKNGNAVRYPGRPHDPPGYAMITWRGPPG